MSTSLLLADDSPTIARILQMALQAEPYVIRSVLTAEAALKELKANPPDLFLVDLALPEKSGYDFARLIKKDPKLKKVHVVILASAFDPVNEAEVKASGAEGVITKPFDPADLRAKLREVLEKGAPLPAPIDKDALSKLQVPPEEQDSGVSLLLDGNPQSGDADAILSGILGGPEGGPSASAPGQSPSGSGGTNPSIMLDLSGEEVKSPIPETVLDLSDSFGGGSGTTFAIPGETTAMTALGTMIIDGPLPSAAPAAPAEPTPPSRPAPAKPAPPPAPPKAAPPVTPPPKAEPLSANAQALAAFFEAEIDSQEPKASAPSPRLPEESAAPAPSPDEDAFDASIASIEWGSSADASLNAWSSSAPKGKPAAKPPVPPSIPEDSSPSLRLDLHEPPAAELPPARPAARAPVSAAPASPSARGHSPRSSLNTGRSAGAGAEGASLLFDTGGSSFRFADDYVNRITRSFTGAPHEEVPEDQKSQAPRSLFPQQSDDSKVNISRPAPAAAPGAGGGAWSTTDVQKIEQIVREEVQMVVREVAEKVVWEVIPELAENIIRKELERVMREMEKE